MLCFLKKNSFHVTLQRYSVTLSFFMYHLFALDERKEESEEKDDKTEVKDEY